MSLERPRFLVTGFGPFPGVENNPSAAVALALAAWPPAGIDVAAAVLPVSFRDVTAVYDMHLRALGSLTALVALGVQRGASFRLERRARGRLRPDRPDADGVAPVELELAGGVDLETELDLDALSDALRAAGASEVTISDDAGQYLCARTYHHVLSRAAERGVPGLFLHVPPVEVLPASRQVPIVAALLARLAGQVSSPQRRTSS